jgi:hypothetical protein
LANKTNLEAVKMKKVNLHDLLEEMVDERVHAWILDDGTYYLAVVEENGDEFGLLRAKEKNEIFEQLKKIGLM